MCYNAFTKSSYFVFSLCASGSVVEYNLAKVGVAGSIPVSRSFYLAAGCLQLCGVRFFFITKTCFCDPLSFAFLVNPKLSIEIPHKISHNMQ